MTGQTDFDVTIGQCVESDRNLACAILIGQRTLTGQTDFDVTIEQCAESDRNLACAILIRHKTLSAVK